MTTALEALRDQWRKRASAANDRAEQYADVGETIRAKVNAATYLDVSRCADELDALLRVPKPEGLDSSMVERQLQAATTEADEDAAGAGSSPAPVSNGLRVPPPSADRALQTACMDCGLPYKDFPLDMLFPRAQWLAIHPEEGGLLCAQCMVTRAAKIPGAVVVHAVVEISPRGLFGGSAPQPPATSADDSADWERCRWIADHYDRHGSISKRDEYYECECGATYWLGAPPVDSSTPRSEGEK